MVDGYSFTVINDYHDYDEDAIQPEDDINTDAYVEAAIERNKSDVEARLQLEQRAQYLLRQAELIETSKIEGQCHLRMFRDAAKRTNGNITEAIPPQLLADRPKASSKASSRRTSVTSSLSGDGSQKSGSAADAAEGAGNYSDHRRALWLEDENQRLRDTIEQCCTAALKIQTNADLKIMKLEFEVAHLRQKLADEAANNAKVNILNESLRKQLTFAASDIVLTKSGTCEEKKRYNAFMHIHLRELMLEKNMNGLITSRHKALKENTALKKLLLGTCYGCRQMLPNGLKRTLDAMSSPVVDGCQQITVAPMAESDSSHKFRSSRVQSPENCLIEKKLSFDPQPDAVVPTVEMSEEATDETEMVSSESAENPMSAATQIAINALLEESAAVPVRPPFAPPSFASQPSTRSMNSAKTIHRRGSVSRRSSTRVMEVMEDQCFRPEFSSSSSSNQGPLEQSESEGDKGGEVMGMAMATRDSPTSTVAMLTEGVSLELPHSSSSAMMVPNDYEPPQPPAHRAYLQRELSGKRSSESQRVPKRRSVQHLGTAEHPSDSASELVKSPRRGSTVHKTASSAKDKKSAWKNLVFQVPGE
jgi:hypothetical protein